MTKRGRPTQYGIGHYAWFASLYLSAQEARGGHGIRKWLAGHYGRSPSTISDWIQTAVKLDLISKGVNGAGGFRLPGHRLREVINSTAPRGDLNDD